MEPKACQGTTASAGRTRADTPAKTGGKPEEPERGMPRGSIKRSYCRLFGRCPSDVCANARAASPEKQWRLAILRRPGRPRDIVPLAVGGANSDELGARVSAGVCPLCASLPFCPLPSAPCLLNVSQCPPSCALLLSLSPALSSFLTPPRPRHGERGSCPHSQLKPSNRFKK